MDRLVLLLIAVVLLVIALGYGTLRYLTSVPGMPHRGALPPLTEAERVLAVALRQHIEVIAAREHNVVNYDELEKVARYIEATLQSHGFTVGRQEFVADGQSVRNIDVTIEPRSRNAGSGGDRRRRPLRQRAQYAGRQ